MVTATTLAKMGLGALRLASLAYPQLGHLIPIVERVAAGVPLVEKLIADGHDALDAVEKATPDFLPNLKKLAALAIYGNTDATATTAQAMEYAGPVLLGRPWTQEETQRWFDKAQGMG